MGLKGNQETFHDEVSLYLDDCISSEKIEVETDRTKEKTVAELKPVYVTNYLRWIGLKTAANGRG